MPWATWNRLGILLGLALVGCGVPSPSILLVTLDTVRRDHIGSYGAESGLTPSLDALASEGLVHDAAYTTMPTTAPAHVSLFTGLYPSEHGVRRNGDPLPAELAARGVAARLRRRGYATAAFVTSRLMSARVTGLSGFEIYDSPTGVLRPGATVVEAALAWLRVEERRPIFLFVHLYDAHAPYGSAGEKGRSFPVDPSRYGWVDALGRYKAKSERVAMAERYARGVRSADAALGRLVEGVRALLETAPVVVVVADHGESLDEHLVDRGYGYDHGEFLDSENVTIPLVLAGPGVEPGRSPGTVSIRDLYATLLAAAGVEDPEAAGGDRRDLRRARSAPRRVGIERRHFGLRVRDSVRTHGAAASDGGGLVIVAEDGSRTAGPAETGDDLLAAARARLGGGGLAGEPLDAKTLDPEIPLDPNIRQALQELGYAE